MFAGGLIKALTFDMFGTVLDLGTSLQPHISEFLVQRDAQMKTSDFWAQWRTRQRIEQYQDTIMMLGHSGYLETARRAFVYTLGRFGIEATAAEVGEFMRAWRELQPFPEVISSLERLQKQYRLVVLSNGEPEFLDHLARNQVSWEFDDVISVSSVGVFKPHPAVYRRAARDLGLEVGECLMVSANSFDAVGARACGFRAVYVNRYDLPCEDLPFGPYVSPLLAI